MRFRGPLIEALLLKRYFGFLVDVSLKNKKKKTIYCPNLGPLTHCDILGSRIWISGAGRLSQGYLDVWELVEVNGGCLVSIHPEHSRVLVREGVHLGVITELRDYRFLHAPIYPCAGNGIELLLKENGEQCFVHIEQVIFADEKGEGSFPETRGTGILPLRELMALKEAGHRAVLLYCVQHTGIHCIRPADNVDSLYGKLLREAVSLGVEVLAYRVNITLRDMNLDCKIPILLSEGITY